MQSLRELAVIRNGQMAMRRQGMSNDHVAAGLMAQFISDFRECADGVLAGNNREFAQG